jgi:hypothetical protein
MELTKEQIIFLDSVCVYSHNWTLNSDGEIDVTCRVDMRNMKLTEIPVKFGKVNGWFNCENNKLTSMKNFPNHIENGNLQMSNNNISSFNHFPLISRCGDTVMSISGNPLNDYLRNIKEDDFPYWKILNWYSTLKDFPFLINIGKKYFDRGHLNRYLNDSPLIKLYLK